MNAQESSGNGSPSVTSHRMSAGVAGSKSRFIQPGNGSLPQPTFTLSGNFARLRRAFAWANLLSLPLLARNASARRPTPIRIRRGSRYLDFISLQGCSQHHPIVERVAIPDWAGREDSEPVSRARTAAALE